MGQLFKVLVQALDALSAAQSGATLYRAGITGVQETTGAQFWSLTHPLTTSNYADVMGMPAASAAEEGYSFVMGARLLPGAAAITRLAPAVEGGAIEVVTGVATRAVRILWFIIPEL
jgi:hypothetical protein